MFRSEMPLIYHGALEILSAERGVVSKISRAPNHSWNFYTVKGNMGTGKFLHVRLVVPFISLVLENTPAEQMDPATVYDAELPDPDSPHCPHSVEIIDDSTDELFSPLPPRTRNAAN